jgi:hypothetical protein
MATSAWIPASAGMTINEGSGPTMRTNGDVGLDSCFRRNDDQRSQ